MIASVDDYFGIGFTISPQIRDIAYHHPDSLPIEAYYFTYHYGSGGFFPQQITSGHGVFPAGTRFAEVLRSIGSLGKVIATHHKGPLIAVTLNDRLDYFGQTVNIASRVQNLADADEIYVTHDVYIAEGVQDCLAHCRVTSESAHLKGVIEEMQVYKIHA